MVKNAFPSVEVNHVVSVKVFNVDVGISVTTDDGKTSKIASTGLYLKMLKIKQLWWNITFNKFSMSRTYTLKIIANFSYGFFYKGIIRFNDCIGNIFQFFVLIKSPTNSTSL